MNLQKQGRADFAVWLCDFQFDTARLKPAPQKTKKTVFPKTAEKFTEPLKNLTKLLQCVILQTVKDN